MQEEIGQHYDDAVASISWSGTTAAYVSRRSDNWSLRTIDIASGNQRALLSSPKRLPTARLSGDGNRVVFTSSDYDLMSIPSAGGAAEKLCEHCGEVMGASGNGRQALYEPLENEDILLYDSDADATATPKRPDADVIPLQRAVFARRQVDGRSFFRKREDICLPDLPAN